VAVGVGTVAPQAYANAKPAKSVWQIPLTILAAVLWSVGWLAAKVSLAVLWLTAAVRLGWSDGRTPRRRD
jgi:hypothetical protein